MTRKSPLLLSKLDRRRNKQAKGQINGGPLPKQLVPTPFPSPFSNMQIRQYYYKQRALSYHFKAAQAASALLNSSMDPARCPFRKGSHMLDESSRYYVQKLADAAERAFADRALLLDEN
ncbi:hypothetical protein GJ744_004437 [Endocarpon pusillum]|uniref:Uncharacterized protein n=1 Tax=Endocarpon pusillum TaxID=364733 RepID=A0A8H7ATL5_9EURO|nr:hypothetical protein GJ744_004437 [Endocarpon pusillum]